MSSFPYGMIRPPHTIAATALPYLPHTTQSIDDGGLDVEKWSALIGIVTAIVGNILISFALNLQRYAHILLERERVGKSLGRSGGRRKSKSAGIPGYGTQENLAEERARRNREAPVLDEEDEAYRAVYHGEEEELGRPNGKTQDASSSDEASVGEEKEQDPETTSYLRSPYWWAGILLMMLGETGNFLAYGFAPASIVSPLGVVALISNCIVAPCLLKEPFRQRDFWGVLVAVGGAVTVVLSAKEGETKMGPQEVWQAITRWEFELYLGITMGMILALSWASDRYGDRSVMIDIGLVGLYGGFTALSTKGVASLISDTLFRALTFPITYLLAFILVATAFMQIRYTNRALQRFDSTQVIPTQFVCFTIAVIVGSAVLYRDFESATADRVGKFIGGCVLTFLGVYLITSGRPHGNDDDDLDEEQGIGLIDEETEQLIQDEDFDHATQVGNRTASSGTHIFYGVSEPSSRSSIHTRSSHPSTPHRHNSTTSSSASLDTINANPTPTLPRHPLNSTSSTPLLSAAAAAAVVAPSSHRPSATSRASSSMAMVLPGPLSSPLSSSLSVVVASTLRRGLSSSSASSRPGSQRLRSAALHNAHAHTQSHTCGHAPSLRLELEGSDPRLARMHSVGSSLRGIFLRGWNGGESKAAACEEREIEERDVK